MSQFGKVADLVLCTGKLTSRMSFVVQHCNGGSSAGSRSLAGMDGGVEREAGKFKDETGVRASPLS
jgi:hypothetical protein